METGASDKTVIADFTALLVARSVELVGAKEVFKVVGTEPGRGFLGLGANKAAIALAQEEEGELKNKTTALIALLSNAFGVSLIEQHLEDIYTKLEKKHSPVLANTLVLPLIPTEFLEKYRLHYLSKEELETRVLEKTKEVEQLKELDKRKSEFLSVMAHQLRTPLTGIKWALTMLLHTEPELLSDVQKKLLASCNEGNERMITIVNSMLQADRINMGTFELKPVETDFVALVESVIEEQQLTAMQREVTITLTPDANIPKLMIDKDTMRFALQNLVNNAIKYSLPKGTISIHIRLTGSRVECSIADHGIGIPLDQQQYIFSRFYRAKNAIATEPNGNGLGLFIVKSIVEKQGGTIGFTSEENKGTTFYFLLNT